ncbi:DNA recombination protein RmuC [Candidatus Gottesmanbacteria bacterium]|nr:DNA recombination protein RmuC [Candidatus Gottesmanbacteria bacterium]
MDISFLLISLFIFVGFVSLFFFLRTWIHSIEKRSHPTDEILAWLKSTNARIDAQNKNIVETLQTSTKAMNDRLDNAAKFIAAVQKNIGEMSEIGRGMKELQEFLQSPKLRGNIGEQILKELLGQMLPKQSFYLQHTFKSGVTVDAAIKTGNGIISVDSKFPMENFRKLMSVKDDRERKIVTKDFIDDVKRHINDISRKYIVTEEGTVDYALMYIPSEAVYYEIVNNPDVFDFASSKRVLPVSPMTFYAYLRAILMSFEGQKIEEQAKQILRIIRAVQKDYLKVDENMGILQKHINNAYNQMNNVFTSFTLLGQKLTNTTSFETNSKKELEE